MDFQNSFTIPGELVPAARGDLIARYKRLRAVSFDLHNRLVSRIPEGGFETAAERLGMLQGGTIVLDTEQEVSVLADYCLYDLKFDGRTIIERLADDPPPADANEATCILAMRHARYSLFVVESVERGLGVVVRDLQTLEIRLVIDLGFAGTAKVGLVVAARLIPFGDFSMTSGAALPVGSLGKDRQVEFAAKFAAGRPSSDGRFDPAPLIREVLRRGASQQVRYENASHSQSIRGAAAPGVTHEPIGRNSPCPCGSGKKYKHCCLRRA